MLEGVEETSHRESWGETGDLRHRAHSTVRISGPPEVTATVCSN